MYEDIFRKDNIEACYIERFVVLVGTILLILLKNNKFYFYSPAVNKYMVHVKNLLLVTIDEL